MSILDDEIQQLQLRIILLEKQKKDYCFILNDFILTDIKDSDTSKKKQVFQKYIDNLNKD